jgi:hypothetical protein
MYTDTYIKFQAVDLTGPGNYQATVVVSFKYQYGTFTIQEVCDVFSNELLLAGSTVMETQCGFELNGLEAGRITFQYELEGVNVNEYMYIMVENTRIWMVELLVDPSVWSSYKSTFVKIAESFALD